MTIHRTREIPVITNVSRRRMLKGLAAGSAFVLAARFPALAAPPFYPTGAEAMPNKTVSDPKVFIAIAPDGTVTIVAARAEMGTGAARTTLPMMIADELEADWAKVRIRQSEGDEVKYGNQDTDGSRSTRHFIQPMRLCGASMRTMLEQAAAKKWGVSRGGVRGREPSGRAQAVRPQARLRRARGGCVRASRAGAGEGEAQGAGPVPLHGQGQRAGRRPDGHHDRQGDLRPGRESSRPEVRRDRAFAGRRRQGRVGRLDRGDEGAGRREDRADRRHARAREVRAARRRRGGGEEHLGGDERPRGAQDHVG